MRMLEYDEMMPILFFLSTINSEKERGSHGALRSQLSTVCGAVPKNI